jgi:uncharacterized protein with GYD domain
MGGNAMTIFITQGRFTREAMAGMVAKPEDRAVTVAKLAKAAGGKLISYYFTFGEYDFLIVLEGPDEKLMASALIVAGSTGGVTNLKTTIAMTSADAKKCFATAGGIAKSFRPAGK